MSDTDLLEETQAPKKVSFAHKLWTGQISYEFVPKWRRWYALSAILIIISIGAIVIRGLDLGIEFRGGANFKVEVAQVTDSTVEQFRVAVMESGVANLDATMVTTIGTNRVSIETRPMTVEEQATVRASIAESAGVDPEAVDSRQISGSWGGQVTKQAAIALVVFLVLVSLLMSFYFRDWKMAVAGLAGLFHDMIITVGIYALVGFTVTPATLTGMLTILGYSLYDTVVVFDKVRENTANLDECKMTYGEAANKSVNQVLVRSINTTIIGVLPVAAILFAGAFILGSGPLEDIGLSLFVGMIVAAYSSIFIATPLLVQLKMAEPAMKEQAAKVERRRKKISKTEAAKPVSTPTYSVEVTTTADAQAAYVRQQPTKTPRSKRAK
ncbi:MAG: protein translocase subunit SecF [Propionibacteriaceae bacterium]|jgi:preprotein translocase subunit SecF|nr:protein translocase subunit SecF [Propionibacteriaceae bacterium]